MKKLKSLNDYIQEEKRTVNPFQINLILVIKLKPILLMK